MSTFFAWEFETPGLVIKSDKFGDLAEARAAAWAWYERRLALACRHDVESGALLDDPWPICLSWTDERMAAVEEWLAT